MLSITWKVGGLILGSLVHTPNLKFYIKIMLKKQKLHVVRQQYKSHHITSTWHLLLM